MLLKNNLTQMTEAQMNKVQNKTNGKGNDSCKGEKWVMLNM